MVSSLQPRLIRDFIDFVSGLVGELVDLDGVIDQELNRYSGTWKQQRLPKLADEGQGGIGDMQLIAVATLLAYRVQRAS